MMERNGVVEAKPDEFQSFVTRLRKMGYYSSLVVTIPADIRHFLELKAGDTLLIAIKKMSNEDALSQYGYTSLKKLKKPQKPQYAKCPLCQKKGTINWCYSTIVISHAKKHGFSQITRHTISRRQFPHFYAKIEKMSKSLEET